MDKRLDILDIRIIEAIGKEGPRNITGIAKKLDVPIRTVHYRLKRISCNFFLRFNLNIYHTNLGLKKAAVFAETEPGREDSLKDCLQANGFWIYLARYFGNHEGWFGLYTIPTDNTRDFEQFLGEIGRLGVARNIRLHWSTCFHSVNLASNWFDPYTNTWSFPWESWIQEIRNGTTELPQTLKDPEEWTIKGDYIDVFILKEMEKNARVDFVNVAKMLGIDPRRVQYHFKNHIVSRGLMEGFKTTIFQFDESQSDWLYFVFKFSHENSMKRFASSLLDKPFVRTLGKVLGKNELLALLYMPRVEFRRLVDALSKIVRNGWLEDFDHVVLDMSKSFQQTISYEFFKEKTWVYEHDKHMENLKRLIECDKRLPLERN